ncbi:MAG: hypothetical protein KF871_12715 [Hydrogenophaga sp.]|uniref:hypothetical protein n=1 Tax=Hydrogenophaga sp. TaxID=1904254 RepID=UPI001D7410B3|nr:hypothetical protein [Hydrogenophaga sp.]MBX3610749.1 hypothetical protein [Hydrogenophaga sp.]
MEEESIAILTSPAEYSHHIGEVASVGSQSLKIIRRQLSVKEPYNLEVVPFSAVSRAEYKHGLAPFRIVAGVLLIVLLGGIFYFAGLYWDSLGGGTRVPVGMLGLAGLYGLRWAFMSRRHCFDFHLHNGGRIGWKSGSGDFKYKQRAVDHVLQFLRGKGLTI